MSRRRMSFTEKRRARLAMKWDRLEKLESKHTITEPISVLALSTNALRGLAQLGLMQADGGNSGLLTMARLAHQARQGPARMTQAPAVPKTSIPIGIVAPMQTSPAAGGGGGATAQDTGQNSIVSQADSNDTLALSSPEATSAAVSTGISMPWHPAAPTGGGGAVMPRGGSGGPSTDLIAASSPTRSSGGSHQAGSSASAGSSAGGSSSALLSTLGLGAGRSAMAAAASAPASGAVAGTTFSRNTLAATLNGGSGGSTRVPVVHPLTSPAFELLTLDYNDGSVMVPGYQQLATPGGSVDLRAQVRDSASGTYTYSWSTTGLTSATGVSGSSSNDLTFQWNTTIATASAQSVTLTVTDPGLNVVSQTYTFWVPAGTGTATGGTTWNNATLDPGLLQAGASAFASQNVSVVEDTGAVETSINLPSYNPNIPGLSLQYDSLAANALPIIVAEHAISGTTTPSQVSAQLTFNSSAGSTYYYSTSALQPGDIMQIGLQANAASLSTGSYPYTMTIAEIRGTPTTFTYTGNAIVENAAQDATFSALGAGWTVGGLEKIISGTGGVILDEGSGSAAWFSGSFGGGGGTYTSPAGTFSTLVLNSNGSYTLTETNGTKENFNSSGLETTSVDRNGLTTTFAYSSSRLQTITDPFSGITTFTYNGSNELQSIKDPAGRLATFTNSSGDLTAVQYPDSSTWNYGYDGSGRLTSVTEPSSAGEPTKITTITYDFAERVGTITRADSTTEEFSPAQVQGWTNSGTSGSPAPSLLLAEVGSVYTDPLGDKTTDSPDWRGMGLTNQETDALGDVSTTDRDANGLATITIDPLNRISQFAHDGSGNLTRETYPDLSTTTYGTYNSFAEPATVTDQLGRISTFTYDAHGNRTVVEDPMTEVTTFTFSGTQPGMLTAQTAPAPAGSSSYTLVSYQYDSKDRQTTITNADSDVTVNAFSSAGQMTSVTDPNNNVNTFSFDAMNRETGTTIAAGSAMPGLTKITYDAAGNEVTSTNPDNFTTTMTYDALDRKSTVTDAVGGVTTYVYDNDGRLSVLIDSVSNRTTYAYDAVGRQTTLTSPSVNSGSGVVSSIQFDADGEVTETTDADGRQITYSYDQIGRQLGETWLNGMGSAIYTATFTYDADGEMKTALDSNATLTMSYDNDGRLGTVVTSGPGTGQPTVTLTYGYDPSGDVTSIKDSLSGAGAAGQGITSLTYDNALRLGTIAQSLGGTLTTEIVNTYDAGGRLTGQSRPTVAHLKHVLTNYNYDAANNLLEVKNEFGLGSSTSGDDLEQTPDAASMIVSQTYNIGSSMNTYGYDHTGQLTSSSGSFSATYTYDLNGNRNSTGYATGAGNELTNSSGVTYTYDNDGNMITATTLSGTTTYTYDYENRLTNVDIHGTMAATYTYDVLGRRIGIDDSGTQTWTVFNGSSADANPYTDFSSAGSLTMRYLDGLAVDAVLAQTDSSGNVAWYLKDELGSITDIVNNSATSLDHVVYDPFGNIVTQTNATNAVRFGFAGMEYDSVTGLYYDHARYYDAVIGRFVSQDPMGFVAGDADLYRYASNEPTTRVDVSGEQQTPASPYGALSDLINGTPGPGPIQYPQPGPVGYPIGGVGGSQPPVIDPGTGPVLGPIRGLPYGSWPVGGSGPFFPPTTIPPYAPLGPVLTTPIKPITNPVLLNPVQTDREWWKLQFRIGNWNGTIGPDFPFAPGSYKDVNITFERQF